MDNDPHRNDPPNHVGKPMNGNGTDIGWSVEARLAYYNPQAVAGLLLDDRWQTVSFPEGRIGVPRSSRYSLPWFAACGLYDYAAAQALRWWFIAQAEAEGGAICLETRLIKHQMKYSYEHTAESAHAYIGGDDRSHIMPDGGAKAEPIKAAA